MDAQRKNQKTFRKNITINQDCFLDEISYFYATSKGDNRILERNIEDHDLTIAQAYKNNLV